MTVQELIHSVPPAFYWIFVALSSFIENVFPPYPGDTVTVFGGALAGQGVISLWSLSVSVFVGSMLGAYVMYYAGEKILDYFARQDKIKSIKELVSDENMQKAHDWFERFGTLAVIFSRFSAGIRFFVAIVAGAVRMHLLLFSLSFALATVIWNALLIYGGYILGNNFEKALDIIQTYNIVILLILGVLLIIYLVYRYKKKKR